MQGNKAIALKRCRNVAIRDVTMVNGGHFGILPTAVDNFRIDNLVIDTNRDGIDIDCCKNVRISNTTVNSPNDDAIVLKSSYALNEVRDTENVTIDNCMVSGYDVGTLIDGTFKTGPVRAYGPASSAARSPTAASRTSPSPTSSSTTAAAWRWRPSTAGCWKTSRSATSPCATFRCRSSSGWAPACAAPPACRSASCAGSASATSSCYDADPRYPSTIAGIPGHGIEDVRISDVRHHMVGGLTTGDAVQDPPELEDAYPEPSMFGTLPGVRLLHPARRGR